MTILEFLKSATAEDIAKNKSVLEALDIGYGQNYFSMDAECPMECRYLTKDEEYECECYNGYCSRYENPCPYSIDRDAVVKKQIIEWLNREVKNEEK